MKEKLLKLRGWYDGLDSKHKWCVLGAVLILAVLVFVVCTWIGGAIAKAIGSLFSGTTGVLSGNEARKLLTKAEKTIDANNKEQQAAVQANQEASEQENREIREADSSMHKANREADNAAVNGEDQSLIDQALDNAKEIEKGNTVAGKPRRGGKGSLYSFFLPFLPLILSVLSLTACATAGAAGGSNPQSVPMITVKKTDFLRIVKSQNICLRDLKAMRASKKGQLLRQRNGLQSSLNQCHNNRKMDKATINTLSKKKVDWLPWTLLAVETVVLGIVIGWLASKAFPVGKAFAD